MAWRVGMKVAVVGGNVWTDQETGRRRGGPAEGGAYTIAEIDDWEGRCFLVLEEYPRSRSFVSTRFRPLTDISIFEEIRDGKRRVADAPIDPAFETAMAEAFPDRVPDYVRGRG